MSRRLRLGLVAGLVLFAVTTMAATTGWSMAAERSVDDVLADARDAIARSDYAGAVALTKDLLRRDELTTGELVETLRLKGSAHLRAENYDRAIASLGSALNFAPDDLWLLWQSCWASTQAGYLPTARRDCRRARVVLRRASRDGEAQATDEVYVAFAEAELARSLGQPDLALKLLTELVDHAEGKPVDWFLEQQIGLALHDLGASQRAIVAFDRALDGARNADNRERAFISYSRGAARFELRQFTEAAEDFQEAMQLDSDRIQYAYALCATDLVGQRDREALATCGRLHGLDPGNAAYLDAHGLALLRNGEPVDALRRFGEAVSLEPSNAIFRGHLELALKAAGKRGLAVDVGALVDPLARGIIEDAMQTPAAASTGEAPKKAAVSGD